MYRIELTPDELIAAEKTMRLFRFLRFLLTPAGKTFSQKLSAAHKRMVKGAK